MSAGTAATPFGLPTLDRFPQFSTTTRKRPFIGTRLVPKTAEIDQTWPFFLIPSSAVALLHYPQPSTKYTWSLDFSPQAQHRDARPRVCSSGCLVSQKSVHSNRRCAARVCLTSHNPRCLYPRSRVCGVSLLATDQRNMRVLLTVADNRKSATARGLNEKMANLFRFAPFRDQVQVQSVPMKCP